METFGAVGFLLLSYLLGSIPTGLIIVRLTTGKDLRTVESGRTGGTNAMRAAGVKAGLITAITDALKAAVTVWISRAVFPDLSWLHAVAPLMAILGHNYSIFLIEKKENGSYRLRGGAGGAPAFGGAMGLWAPNFLIILPLAILIFYFIGYASVTTLSVAVIATIVFVVRAWLGLAPWEYVLYGLGSFVLLVIALLPNIRRLLNGTERVVGYRAKRKKNTGEGSSPAR